MKTKQAIAMFFAAAMITASLSACGQKAQAPAGGSTAAAAPAEATYKWRMASTWNESDPQGQGDAFFAKRLNELTNGQVEVTVYPSMQFGDPNKALDSVRQGIIELAVVAPSTGTDPRLAVTTLPFLAENFDEANKLFYSDSAWLRYVKGIFSDCNMTWLATIDNDFRGMSTVSKPVTKPEDLKGMLIRESGYKPYQDFYAACGASCTVIPFSELYTALEKGLCDAQDNGPLNTSANKLYEAAPYYTYLQQAYSVTFDVMNKNLYDGLPEDIRKAVDQAAKEAQDFVNEKIQAGHANKALDALREAGVKVITKDELDPADYAEFRKLGLSVWKNYEDVIGPELLKELYDFKGYKG